MRDFKEKRKKTEEEQDWSRSNTESWACQKYLMEKKEEKEGDKNRIQHN